MRAGLTGAIAGWLMLGFLSSPAFGRTEHLSGSLRTTGAIYVAWHGDPGRGCEAAGTCGLTGTVAFHPAGVGEIQVDLRDGILVASGGETSGEQPPSVVRVRRESPTGAVGTCVDVLDADQFGLLVEGDRPGRALLRFPGFSLSSGRCGGPTARDLRGAMPGGELRLGRLRHGVAKIDLSRRRPLFAGSFAGEIVSSVRIGVGRLHPTSEPGEDLSFGDEPVGRPPHRLGRPPHRLTIDFRVEGLDGSVGVSWHGFAAPGCQLLDACGMRGRWDLRLGLRRGVLEVSALTSTARFATALRQLRAGRLQPEGYVELGEQASGQAATTVSRDGDPDCRDTLRTPAPELDLGPVGRGLALALGWSPSEDTGDDVLRSHCPGPYQEAGLGDDPVALARIDYAALLRRRLAVTLSGDATFTRGRYGGRRSADLTLRLRRRSIRFARAAAR